MCGTGMSTVGGEIVGQPRTIQPQNFAKTFCHSLSLRAASRARPAWVPRNGPAAAPPPSVRAGPPLGPSSSSGLATPSSSRGPPLSLARPRGGKCFVVTCSRMGSRLGLFGLAWNVSTNKNLIHFFNYFDLVFPKSYCIDLYINLYLFFRKM